MKAGELMSRGVVTCAPDDTLGHAARLMWDHDIGYLPVVHLGAKVVGVLTDRDICMAAYTQDKPLSQLRVSSAMARLVHSCVEDDTLEAAEALMRDHQVRRIPVTDWAQRLVGVLSLNDVARHADTAPGAQSDGLAPATVMQLLAAVSEPRTTRAA